MIIVESTACIGNQSLLQESFQVQGKEYCTTIAHHHVSDAVISIYSILILL